MAEIDGIHNLSAARKLLKTSLENSRALASALERTGPRLEEIKIKLPALEAQVGPCSSRICKSVAFRDHVDLAVGPAAAVLKMFDSIRQLEEMLLSVPSLDDLSNYISATVRLEEALKFLADNCRLAIQWLQGLVEFMADGDFTIDDRYISKLQMSFKILQELQGTREHACLKGGLLYVAFDKLETLFKRLLMDTSLSSLSTVEQGYVASAVFPGSILGKLQAIVKRLNANGRLKNCRTIIVEARSMCARRSLQTLDTDFLKKSITESDDFQDIEGCITQWGKQLELAVKYVLELEYRLCKEVFNHTESDVWTGCFAEISAQSGILSLLQFGMSIAKSKKDPIKLLKLLQVFAVLDQLRMDFNRLFGGVACVEIQNMTRDLIKKVVNGVDEIFWELPLQVEQQRQSPPPTDGSIPRLVTFVTDYSNQLLGDKYRPMLTKVLEINQMWKNEKYEEVLFTGQIYSIMREIAVNLDVWSKAYESTPLSYIFMMNNHCHFHSLKVTSLGSMMGDSWLSAHGQYKDYYAALYLKETWGKLLHFLTKENQISSSPNSRTGPNLLKKSLKAFNEAFEDIYKMQSNWVISDKGLRQKMCQLLVQTIVPAYKYYLQNYTLLVEGDADASKHVKYSSKSLENMLNILFWPKLLNFESMRDSSYADEIQNVLRNQCCLTLKAM
ncbi:hypothetical protein SLEP1_g23256 [Rubroshorea leprosula]|uniref:Exocyst subunit Exo70 family protein n=1 Tax=Rubroshorea leprosula TaxID=152421 RepID=A0AAV5JBQ5_9ROSI|nr:hypothetical protein SLEP1_g23256 [Rubroshorea leprosula]